MTDCLLRVEALNCNFDGVPRAVADLNFDVRAGQIKAVIGPNGAGKSTLFNMIAGVTRPTSGRIWFDGARIDTLPTFRRARLGIARTFQNLQIFREMTVLENVMTGRHIHGEVGLLGTLLHSVALRGEERSATEAALDLLARFELDGKAHMRAGDLGFAPDEGTGTGAGRSPANRGSCCSTNRRPACRRQKPSMSARSYPG